MVVVIMLFTAKKVSVFLVVNQMEISQDFFFFFPLDFEILENEHWDHRAW